MGFISVRQKVNFKKISKYLRKSARWHYCNISGENIIFSVLWPVNVSMVPADFTEQLPDCVLCKSIDNMAEQVVIYDSQA